LGERSYYRADIDGLRAIAVLSVLLFHLDMDAFSGGFVGVDVFFVISGFLITRLILHDFKSGTFSFGRFYVRRARRIFPVLFLTLAATLAAGYLFFSDQHLVRLGGSALSAVFSLSNFYFWGEAGYFDTAASLKPLLHTWSLGIEEQFYLLWPAVLVLLLSRFPRWAPLVFIVLGGALSLFLSEFFVRWPSIAFFLLPFRAFEFGLGAILVWAERGRFKNAFLRELCVALGLGLIGYSVLFFDAETPFPGLAALVPCVGTSLVIYAGETRFLSRILSNPLAVAMGLISYSLYLVHWPLVVFYKYLGDGALDVGARWQIALVSVFLAALMYRFVERPFRYGRHEGASWSAPAVGLASALAALVIAVPAAVFWQADWQGARSGVQQAVGFKRISEEVDLSRPCEGLELPYGTECSLFGEGEKTLLVWGDSHAKAFLRALRRGALETRGYQVMLIAHEGCPPIRGVVRADSMSNFENCDQPEDLERVFAQVKALRPELLMLVARWSVYIHGKEEKDRQRPANHFLAETRGEKQGNSKRSEELVRRHLLSTILEYQRMGAVLVVAPVPTVSAGEVPALVSKGIETFPSDEHREYQDKFREILLEVGDATQARALDFSEVFCDAKSCRIGIEGTPLYTDSNHVSPLGSLMVWARFEAELRALMGLD